MKKISYLLIIGLFISTPIFAQDSIKLNLEKCRNLALDNNYKVKIADANIKQVEKQKIAARSAYFPNVSFSTTAIYSKHSIREDLYLPNFNYDPVNNKLVPDLLLNPATGMPVFDESGNAVFNSYSYMPIDISTNGGFMSQITAEQPIFTGGKIITANRKANLGIKMANSNKALENSKLIYETDQAFYQYITVKEKLKLANEYQNLMQELLDVVSDAYDESMITKSEVLKVQVKYNESILQVQMAENGLKLSSMALCRIIGIDLSSDISINDTLIVNSAALLNIDNINANNRIEYSLLSNQVEMAKLNVDDVRAEYLPSAGISVGYSYLNVDLKNKDNYTYDGMNAIGKITIPITRFGEGYGKVEAAKIQQEIKEYELEHAKNLLQLEIEKAKIDLLDSFKRVEITQKTLKQAEENIKISRDNYELGMETIVNLLQAQTERQNYYSEYIDAKASYNLAESNLNRISNSY